MLDEDEVAVLAHAAAGLTWQEVGASLGASERTVRRRFADAAAKLGAAGVVQTVAVAVARGLVDPEQPLEPAAITPRPGSPRPAAPSPAPDPAGATKPGPKPSRTITEAIPRVCAALPSVNGSLPKACIIAGVDYGAVFNRQAKDADLRRLLREAGWLPGKRGPQAPRPRVVAALDTVLAELAGGATLNRAAERAGISPPTVRYHADQDPEFRKKYAQARREGRRAREAQRAVQRAVQREVLPDGVEEFLTVLRRGTSLTHTCAEVGVSESRVKRWRDRFPRLDTEIKQILEENRRRDPAWVGVLLTALESGAAFKHACEVAGIHVVTAHKARRERPGMDARVRAAIEEGKRRSHDSRWRQGDRDGRARREHNKATRDQRRRKTLERFTPELERALLVVIRSGAPLTEAAGQVGMTQQTLFGRARFDRAWAARLDRALTAGRDPGIGHGTDYAYKTHGCRCPECREAHARFRGR